MDEFILQNTQIFQTNFTLFSSLCLETLERVKLCNISLDVLVEDQSLPLNYLNEKVISYRRTILAREHVKCSNGLSGLQSNFTFQFCVIGNTCSDLINCFGAKLNAKIGSDIDRICILFFLVMHNILVKLNNHLDEQVKTLGALPTKDIKFNEYLNSKNNNPKPIQTISAWLSTTGIISLISGLIAEVSTLNDHLPIF